MDTFSLKVVSPSGMELEREDVSFLKVRTTRGDIGILAKHINYVTSLGEGQMIVRFSDKKELSFFVAGGFLEVKDNVVFVIAEDIIESSQEEIVRLQRQQAIEEATRQKVKEDRDILGTKKRIQDSLRK